MTQKWLARVSRFCPAAKYKRRLMEVLRSNNSATTQQQVYEVLNRRKETDISAGPGDGCEDESFPVKTCYFQANKIS